MHCIFAELGGEVLGKVDKVWRNCYSTLYIVIASLVYFTVCKLSFVFLVPRKCFEWILPVFSRQEKCVYIFRFFYVSEAKVIFLYF